MLKKMLSLVLSLMLLAGVVPAVADNGADMLTMEELTAWAESYRQMAEESQPLNDPHDADALTEDGYTYVYDFGTLFFDRPDLTADAVLTGLVVYDMEYPGPRGTQVTSSLDAVLDVFRCDNPQLIGSQTAAVVYLEGREAAGVVLRDGQRIQAIQYAVYGPEMAAGVVYTLQDGLVAAIRAFGLAGHADAALVNDEVEAIESARYSVDYQRVPMSIVGSELTPFGVEDLTLWGLDLTSVTPEEAEVVMGDMLEDVWVENEGEGWLRTVDFADCEMTFAYDSAKQNPVLMMVDMTQDGLEGPRGVRVDDTLSSVLTRFRHGEGAFTGSMELLYGTMDANPAGVVEYGQGGDAIVRYTIDLPDGRIAMLMVDFEAMNAVEVLLYLGE